ELAECEGAALFSLGPTTLRAETAAIAACAVVLYELAAA
ncbi:16S rRNA methyltransferase, partial [bacterium]